jgi:hypothetical protein
MNQIVYREGDETENIFFLTKGEAAYINIFPIGEKPYIRYEDSPFLKIERGHYFGEVDFVYKEYKEIFENSDY